jgi:hypothetical protein
MSVFPPDMAERIVTIMLGLRIEASKSESRHEACACAGNKGTSGYFWLG